MTDALDPEMRLSALIQGFHPLGWTGTAGPICEITGANDPGHDCCKTCARWQVRRLRRAGTYPDAEIEGPTLAEDGISDELEFWDCRSSTASVAPDQAYRLEQLLGAVACHHFDRPGAIRRAVEVGERAAAHLRPERLTERTDHRASKRRRRPSGGAFLVRASARPNRDRHVRRSNLRAGHAPLGQGP